MDEFEKTPMNTLKALQDLIADVRNHVDHDLCADLCRPSAT